MKTALVEKPDFRKIGEEMKAQAEREGLKAEIVRCSENELLITIEVPPPDPKVVHFIKTGKWPEEE